METKWVGKVFSSLATIVTQVGTVFLVLILAGGILLWKGIENREPAAYMVVGVLGFIVIVAVVGIGFFSVLYFSYWIQSKNAELERKRDMDNVKENLAIMKVMQQIQNQQNAGLLKQVSHAQHYLPEPDEAIEIDDAIFSELDSERS